MSFTAVYMPDYERTQSGFESEAAAEEYVGEFLCKVCQEDVERGYEEVEFEEGEIDRRDILGPMDTSCGAEWIIIPDEAWETFVQEDKNLAFLFKAAGMKSVDLSKGKINEDS